MTDCVAGPGNLTCVDENCPRSGLRHTDGASECEDCGGPLCRVPGIEPNSPTTPEGTANPVPGRSGGIGNGSSAIVRICLALIVGAVVSGVIFVVNNPDVIRRITGSEFEVGDCVQVRSRLTDHTLSRADCRANSLTTGVDGIVYQIVEVKDGKDADCQVTGFGAVTFSDEPEDRTYCLTPYSGG